MKTVIIVLLILVLLPVGAFLAYGRERVWALVGGPNDLGRYDFAAGGRSATANDALACTPGFCPAPDMVLAPAVETPEAAIASLSARLNAIAPHLERVDDGSDPRYARYVVYTPLMRYPDTVDLRAETAEDGTRLGVYSRSKLGSADFGANAARVRALLAPGA